MIDSGTHTGLDSSCPYCGNSNHFCGTGCTNDFVYYAKARTTFYIAHLIVHDYGWNMNHKHIVQFSVIKKYIKNEKIAHYARDSL